MREIKNNLCQPFDFQVNYVLFGLVTPFLLPLTAYLHENSINVGQKSRV